MADVFRVPMEVTYAIQGGEPALMLTVGGGTSPAMILPRRAAFPETRLRQLRMGTRRSKKPCLKASQRCSRCLRIN